MTEPTSEAIMDVHDFALDKLSTILGEPLAIRVSAHALAQLGLRRLETAEDLYRFGEAVTKRGGFEGAAGSLLILAAVVRGARSSRE